MRKWVIRLLWILATFAAVAYVGACVWLRANENRLVFKRTAPTIPPSPSLALKQQRVEFGEVDGTKLFAWIVPSLRQDHSDIWVLFFHGSGDNVSLSTNAYDAYRSMGFNIMAPEYPGYSDAPGEPSETVIEREAKAGYDYLRVVKQVPAKNIVIFGGSLGTAFAIDLGSRVEAGALIVHGAFASTVAMGKIQYPILPISLLVKNRFESDKKIAHVQMPVLLLHSTEDEVIPFAQAQRLYELAPSPKRFVSLRGRHGPPSPILNPTFYPEIVNFLNTEAGFHVRQPFPSIASMMALTIDSMGIEPALAQYRSLRKEEPPRYNFGEAELKYLGYDLLEKKRVNEAIAVLQLNAEQFPQSFNAFDSLGDAYIVAGKDHEATESYRQSLVLFPKQENCSRPKLDQLQRKSHGNTAQRFFR
jgi:fermentation-respiration switch protein FrsA (DUF1100 family)